MATAAAVYARALFEAAQEKAQTEGVLTELNEFSELAERIPALAAVVRGSGIDPVVRRSIMSDLTKAAQLSELSARFLDILVVKNRAVALPEILKEFSTMVEASCGVLSGELRSAVELNTEEVAVLSGALGKKVGSKVKLSLTVDPNLLGGVVAVVGGKTFDASLRTQLERFRNELI